MVQQNTGYRRDVSTNPKPGTTRLQVVNPGNLVGSGDYTQVPSGVWREISSSNYVGGIERTEAISHDYEIFPRFRSPTPTLENRISLNKAGARSNREIQEIQENRPLSEL